MIRLKTGRCTTAGHVPYRRWWYEVYDTEGTPGNQVRITGTRSTWLAAFTVGLARFRKARSLARAR